MSGLLAWNSGSRYDSGIYGYSWSSTPIISGTYKYISSRHLDFNSTNVYPTYGSYKPFGFTLRCVALQITLTFLLLHDKITTYYHEGSANGEIPKRRPSF